MPAGPGIRDDSGATAGLDVPIFYDPMISKLVAWAEDRPAAIARMQRALANTSSPASRRRVPFFTWLLQQPEFHSGPFHTTYLDELLKARAGDPFVEADAEPEDLAAIAAALQAALSLHAPAPRHGGRSQRRRAERHAGRRGREAKGCADVRYEVDVTAGVAHVTFERRDGTR